MQNLLNTFIVKYFQVIRHLVAQPLDDLLKRNLLMTLWSFISLVIITSFSSKILSLLVVPETKLINTIDELVESQMDVYTHNNSMVYWQLKGFYDSNYTIDNWLAQIKQKFKFIGWDDKV